MVDYSTGVAVVCLDDFFYSLVMPVSQCVLVHVGNGSTFLLSREAPRVNRLQKGACNHFSMLELLFDCEQAVATAP